MEGVDYSYARPSPAALAQAGKRFAVRYIGTPESGKSLDAAEVRALQAVGIDVVAVYQTTASFMLTADGAVAARRAHDHAVACGMPAGRPVYFALDTNPTLITQAQWDGVERFLNGAASVLGRARVGVYAGYAGIERLCPRVAPWGWQTYAWSGSRWSQKAQLQQYRNGVSLAGGTVDLCRSTTPDFGQWGHRPQPLEDDMTPAQLAELKAHIDDRLVRVASWITTGRGNAYVTTTGAWAFSDDAGTITLNEVDDDVDPAELAAALAPLLVAQTPQLSDADLTAVATAVADEQHRRSAA